MLNKLLLCQIRFFCLIVLMISTSGCVDCRWKRYAKHSSPPIKELAFNVHSSFLVMDVSADQRLLAVSDTVRSRIQVVSLTEDQTVREISADWSSTQALSFSPSGEAIMVGTGDQGEIRIIDIKTGEETKRFIAHDQYVRALDWSPDGTTCVSGGDDGDLVLWDVNTGQELKRFEGHTAGIRCLVLSSSGDKILSGSWDGTIRLWNIETGAEEVSLNPMAGRVVSVALSGDNKFALSSYLDRVNYWDLESGKQLNSFAVPGNPWFANRMLNPEHVVFSPDGKRALFAMAFGSIMLWDLQSWSEVSHNRLFKEESVYCTFLNDGRSVLAIGADKDQSNNTIMKWWALTPPDEGNNHDSL